jgi:hypothetical protein
MPLLQGPASRFVVAAGVVVAATLGMTSPAQAMQAMQAMQAARASIGVGVQADPVRFSGVAHPGGSYALPSLFVVNTGSQAESISVDVKRLSSGPGQSVPASWIRIGAMSGDLQPRQQALISLELNAPAGAKPGSYRSDIVVTGVPGGSGATAGGVRFGAAAATALEFRLTAGPGPSGWLGISPWKWWLAIVLALLVLLAAGLRRSGLRIRIETNASGGQHGA